MNNPIYFDLVEACQQIGCPVCCLVQSAVERFLSHLFYESVTDPAVRTRLRRSLGFCRTHAWLLVDARIGDALGMAIIYHDLLGSLLKHLPSDTTSTSVHGSPARMLRRLPSSLKTLVEKVLQAISPRHRCPACEQEESTERVAMRVLEASLDDPTFVEAFKTSGGLCLPHLQQALEGVHSPLALEILFATSREKLAGIRLELAEIIRKNDYRFREEAFGPEGDAWKRVVAIVVGGNPVRS